MWTDIGKFRTKQLLHSILTSHTCSVAWHTSDVLPQDYSVSGDQRTDAELTNTSAYVMQVIKDRRTLRAGTQGTLPTLGLSICLYFDAI
jgi:hypothetical protein